MEIKEYDEALRIIKEDPQNKSEETTNKFFLDLGLGFIDANAKIKRNGQFVGEIDGIFMIKEDTLLLLEISDEKDLASQKIGEFYTKWSDPKNLKLVLKVYGIKKDIEIVKVVIHYKGPSKKELESLSHHFDNPSNRILDKEDMEYFNKSFSMIGKWAKNDLINFLGIHSRKIFRKVSAIRIMMGERKAFLFAMNANELLRTCYIYRKSEKCTEGYQRFLKTNRINKIKKAIENGKTIAFPNSLIVSSNRKLESIENDKTESCEINFPLDYCSLRIIDGQHRLLGFANTSEEIQGNHNLPVVAFDDIEPTEEVKTFIAINTEQKNIDPNLLLILKSGFDWDKKKEPKLFKERQIVTIIKNLNKVNGSPIKNKVYLGYDGMKKGKITLATLVSAIGGNNLLGGSKHLFQIDLDDVDAPEKKIKEVFVELKINIKNYSDISKIGKKKGYFFSNKGLRVLFRLVQFLVRNNIKNKTSIDIKEFFIDLNLILNDVVIKELEKYYGDGGANKATEVLLKKLKKNNKPKYKKFKINLKQI